MTNKISSNLDEYIHSGSTVGLSAKASLVYITLLDAGIPLTPKAVIVHSHLHRQYVYDALHELAEKRLIVTIGKGRMVKYTACSPDKILQEIEKKRLDVLDSVQTLMKLYTKSPAGMVEVVTGTLAVRESEWKMTEEIPEDNGYIDLIGGAGSSFMTMMGETMEAHENLRRSKKIKVRYITSRDDITFHTRYKEEVTPFYEVRYLENINDAINICIRPGSVSFNIYDPEVMVVRVRSEAAVASQRALFEILWNVARN